MACSWFRLLLFSCLSSCLRVMNTWPSASGVLRSLSRAAHAGAKGLLARSSWIGCAQSCG